MSATYSPTLASSVDWVRLLIGDTIVSPVSRANLQDEEIVMMLEAQPDNGKTGGQSSAVYFAAAKLLEMLHARWMTRGKGVASRKVSRLTVVYGTGSGINIDIAIQNQISQWKKHAAFLLYVHMSARAYSFRML